MICLDPGNIIICRSGEEIIAIDLLLGPSEKLDHSALRSKIDLLCIFTDLDPVEAEFCGEVLAGSIKARSTDAVIENLSAFPYKGSSAGETSFEVIS